MRKLKVYNYEVFRKNDKGKYESINKLQEKGIYLLADMCNYHERKVDGEKIKIIKHYTYHTTMTIDVYFNNGCKYIYYDVPCTSGAYIDTNELLKEYEDV